MRIPTSIKIGGVIYPISYVANLRKTYQIAYGHIDYENTCIELSATDGTSHQKRCLILWHEIIHGIIEHANLDMENADEETIIDTIAKGIYQVLQDNESALFDIPKPD